MEKFFELLMNIFLLFMRMFIASIEHIVEAFRKFFG